VVTRQPSERGTEFRCPCGAATNRLPATFVGLSRQISPRANRSIAPIGRSQSRRVLHGAVQKQLIDHALRDFRLAGVGLDLETQRALQERHARADAVASEVRGECAGRTNGWSYHVSDETELRGLNSTLIEQARKRGHEQRVEGWILTPRSPTYVAVVTDAESESLRRAFYEAWTTRASDQGPNAGRWANSGVMEDILRLRHEAARLLEFRSYAEYALSTRMRTVSMRSCSSCSRWLGPNGSCTEGVRGTRIFRGEQARGLGCRFLCRTAATQPLLGLAGRDAAVLPHCRTSSQGSSKWRRDSLAFAITEQAGRTGLHPDVRFFEIRLPTASPSAVSIWMPMHGPTSAARMDGRVRRPQALEFRIRPAGRISRVQLPATQWGSTGTADARRRAHTFP